MWLTLSIPIVVVSGTNVKLTVLQHYLNVKRLLTSVSLCDTLEKLIKSFAHKGIEKFFHSGSKAGIQAQHANKLRVQLAMLDNARKPEDMNAPGWRLHPLHADLKGHWSVMVSGNWRLTFCFDGADAILVDYQDYH